MRMTSWPGGVIDWRRNIQRCGMKLRVTPLSGLYSSIFKWPFFLPSDIPVAGLTFVLNPGKETKTLTRGAGVAPSLLYMCAESGREYSRYERGRARPASGRGLLAGQPGLRLPCAAAVLDDGVDLAPDEDSRTRQVEPEQQDDDRAERAVGRAVTVEVIQVETEAEGDQQPERDPCE